jgi:hypothetical protein
MRLHTIVRELAFCSDPSTHCCVLPIQLVVMMRWVALVLGFITVAVTTDEFVGEYFIVSPRISAANGNTVLTHIWQNLPARL